MINILTNELYKIMARKKLYIFLGIIFLAALLIGLSTLHANNILSSQPTQGEEGLGNLLAFPRDNAQNFPMILLEGVSGFIIPIMVVTFVADMVADEYSEGTLKLPLLRQISRNQLLLGKVVALYSMLLLVLLFVMLIAYGTGLVLLGWGPHFTMKVITFSPGQGILFTIFIYFISALPQLAFGMVVLLFSVLLSSSGEVTGIGVGLLFILSILGSIVNDAAPFLVSGYFNLPRLFYSGFDPIVLGTGALVVSIYGFGFYALSRFVFMRKDILL